MQQGRLLALSTRALSFSSPKLLLSKQRRHLVYCSTLRHIQREHISRNQYFRGRMYSSMSANDERPRAPFIVRFYGNEAERDGNGRTLNEILNFDDYDLEGHHDFIQVIFPLPERSPINPGAPVITKAVRDAFLQQELLRSNMFRSFARMASFYAFDVSGTKEDPTLEPRANFTKLARQTWLTRIDHNHLRITRIIRCLRILGLDTAATNFYDALRANEGGKVSERSLMYWGRAVKRPLHLPPDEPNENAMGIEWLREDDAS